MENQEKTKWVIDPTHSEISFKVKHLMISTVRGLFEEFEGSAETSSESFDDATFNFTAKTKSINTNNKDRDTHLHSDDFFNSEKYPDMTFKSTSHNGSSLTGDLTIREVTKEVTLDISLNGIAVDPYGQKKAGFEASGVINRKDFNLTWSAVTEAGNVVVSDKVWLILDLQFIQQ